MHPRIILLILPLFLIQFASCNQNEDSNEIEPTKDSLDIVISNSRLEAYMDNEEMSIENIKAEISISSSGTNPVLKIYFSESFDSNYLYKFDPCFIQYGEYGLNGFEVNLNLAEIDFNDTSVFPANIILPYKEPYNQKFQNCYFQLLEFDSSSVNYFVRGRVRYYSKSDTIEGQFEVSVCRVQSKFIIKDQPLSGICNDRNLDLKYGYVIENSIWGGSAIYFLEEEYTGNIDSIGYDEESQYLRLFTYDRSFSEGTYFSYHGGRYVDFPIPDEQRVYMAFKPSGTFFFNLMATKVEILEVNRVNSLVKIRLDAFPLESYLRFYSEFNGYTEVPILE